MSDNDWDLWFQYMNDKENGEELYREAYAIEFPNSEYVEPTQEELADFMREYNAA